MTFYVDLAPRFGISTIAALNFASEQGSANLQQSRSLTRQRKGNQIIQIRFVHGKPTKDIHNIIDEDSSMT